LWDWQDALDAILNPISAIIQFYGSLGFQYNPDLILFCQYVQFICNELYISALIIYLDFNATLGIETYFGDLLEISGLRTKLGIHFILQPIERIAHVWVKVDRYQRILIVS